MSAPTASLPPQGCCSQGLPGVLCSSTRPWWAVGIPPSPVVHLLPPSGSSSVRGKAMLFFPHPGGSKSVDSIPIPSPQGHHLCPSLRSLLGPPLLPSYPSHCSPHHPHPQSRLLTWTWPRHSPAQGPLGSLVPRDEAYWGSANRHLASHTPHTGSPLSPQGT